MSSALTSTLPLNSGIPIPRLHLGVYMTSGHECSSAVRHALCAGYRAIDSAEWYANEAEVGSAINSFLASKQNQAGLKREDIWFTTKLKSNISYDATRRSIKQSIKRSGLGYIDLYLLHSPYGGTQKRLECWRAVEDAVNEGECRAGGVSNFGVKHVRILSLLSFPYPILLFESTDADLLRLQLQELLDSNPRFVAAVNQIEVHPFNTQSVITSFCAQHNIVVEAYAPLARSLRANHPKIKELSKKYSCTWAQLMVKWGLQKGYIPLPKSVNEQRIKANAEVDGFEITADDVKVLDGLDEKLVTDWDPTDAD
ncbi:putative oxidoreductase [Lachnellula willkommii]|uniref:Putative oxidoreductase n=1 Tax=Lachnellula willkommii TaxID=215461 RepID=A0A559M093_9HELO|nr:putative oxidoreductase [Lachnellula willkommii]